MALSIDNVIKDSKKTVIAMVMAWAIMLSAPLSYAQCTNNEEGRAGVAGEIEYFTAFNELRYCDGNNWRSMSYDNQPENQNIIYTNDFESGVAVSEWGADIVANYSQFLGRFPGLNGAQGPNRTFTLSGSQDTTTITFDFLRFDSFGGTGAFRVYLDDTQVIADTYQSIDYNVPSGGVNGNVSWSVTTSTPVSTDFAYGSGSEQIYTYTLTITNPGVTSLKLGFGATGTGSLSISSWGIDNVEIIETVSGTPTSIYSENFESGLASGDWGLGETISFSTFLGRFASTGNGQGPNKTISLSGTQDSTTLTFDFYEIDSWDNEQFTLFINDVEIFRENFSINAFNSPSPGSNGNVSWSVANTSSFLTDYGFGFWPEQTFRYTVTITNPGESNLKIGFGNNLNEGSLNEAIGIDNISVVENIGGSPTTVFTEDFEAALPADDWGSDITVTIDGLFGRFTGTGGVQGPSRTFTLPGTQDTTTISFEFYEVGTWDNETFSIYIDDVAVITDTFLRNSFDFATSGTNGNVSWVATNVTPISADFGFEGGSDQFDQVYTYTVTVANPGSTSIKLGFGSNANGTLGDESWAIDDLDIIYTQGGSDTPVYSNNFETHVWPYEWNWTTKGTTTLTTFLGRQAGTGGAQSLNRTFTLSGTQDTTTVEFDFYEIDTWDSEDFRAFINDIQIFSDTYRLSQLNAPSSGTTGNVTYVGQNVSGGTVDLGFGVWSEQITHYRLIVTNPGETSLKLGFGATINEALSFPMRRLELIMLEFMRQPVQQIRLFMKTILKG